MDDSKLPPNPPSVDSHSAKPSEPVSAGHQKCAECRMERPFSRYGSSRSHPTGFRPICKDCTNQTKRNFHEAKFGHVKPRPPEDSHLRNNKHHNRILLEHFLHSTDYDLPGFAYCINSQSDYTFLLRRIPNTSLVEIALHDQAGQHMIYGCDRLKKDAVSDLCSVLREYRLEPTAMAMQMAKLYIYSRP